MSYELTSEDLAKIEGILRGRLVRAGKNVIEAAYRKGILTGIECSVMVCKATALQIGDQYYSTATGKDCAAALERYKETVQ